MELHIRNVSKTYSNKPVSVRTQAVTRGESEWSVGERQPFEAFTSHLETAVDSDAVTRRGRVEGVGQREGGWRRAGGLPDGARE